jgi:hypothetical protein
VLGTEEQEATKAPIKDNNDNHAHIRNSGPSRTRRPSVKSSDTQQQAGQVRSGETARESLHTARHHRHCVSVDQAEGSGGVDWGGGILARQGPSMYCIGYS